MTTGGQERSDRGIGLEDELDDLYGVAPEEFLARRKELAAAAKKRGDADDAKLIGSARRPTAAAWVVNLLVRRDPTARPRLKELTESLKAAHAAMDGPRIRELTGMQRKLIDGLVRGGLAAAGYADPPAALRNDVTDTLQAAIADPDVAARLGRLEKAERWSGFGEFGSATTVGPVPKAQPKTVPKSKPKSKPKTAPKAGRKTEPERSEQAADAEVAALEARVASARANSEAAEQVHAGATEVLSARTAKVATARRRYEKLLETLNAAEGELNAAVAEEAEAEEAVRSASDAAETAKTLLAETESELQRLAASTDSSS
ncbi:MAG: hypothetical protein QOH82_240 [Mycobacterium sp.]|nr:hypothetical protein [Mycobacterium sp.]